MAKKKSNDERIPNKLPRQESVKLNTDLEFRRAHAATILHVSTVAHEVAKIIMVLRGEEYTWRLGQHEETATIEDVLATQQEWIGSQRNAEEYRKKFRRVFDGIASTPHPRAFVSFFKQEGYGKHATGGENEAVRLAIELQKEGVIPTLPNALLPPSFWYVAVGEAVGRIKVMNTLTAIKQGEHEEFLAKIREYKDEIGYSDLENLQAQFSAWKSESEQYNFELACFLSRRWQSVKESLLSGKQPKYNYVSDVYELLTDKYRSLWDNEDGRDYIQELGHLWLLEEKERTERWFSSLRFPDAISSPPHIYLGNNFIKFSLQTDSQFRFTLQTKLIDPDDRSKEKSVKVTSCPSDYFSAAVIIPRSGKESGTFDLLFNKGKINGPTIHGVVKEPQLVLDRRRAENKGIGKLLAGEVEPAYLKLAYTVEQDFSDHFYAADGSLNKLYAAVNYFKTSLSKDADDKRDEVKIGTRLITVDLGIYPIMWATVLEIQEKRGDGYSYELPGIGWANEIASFPLGAVKSQEFIDEVKQFQKVVRAVKSAIGYFKAADQGREPYKMSAFVHTTLTETISSWDIGVSFADDSRALERKLGKCVQKLGEWFDRLSHNNCRKEGISSDAVVWLFAVKEYYRLKRSWTCRKRPPLEKGQQPVQNECAKLMRYIQNVKKDIGRKIPYALQEVVKEYGAHIVVMEDLSEFKFSLRNDAETNDLLSFWPHRSFVQRIRDNLNTVPAVLVLVDPRFTSQVDPLTLEFAYRKGPQQYCEVNGKIEVRNAQESGARMIGVNFLTRHSTLYRLRAFESENKKGEKCWVPSLGLRTGGALKQLVGKKKGVFVQCSDGFKLISCTDKEFNEITEKKSRKSVDLYRHADYWLDRKSHEKLLESYEKRCEGSGSEKTTGSDRKWEVVGTKGDAKSADNDFGFGEEEKDGPLEIGCVSAVC